MEYSAFQGRFQPCIHIDSVKILLSHVDALNDVSPTVEFADMHACVRTVYIYIYIYQSINQIFMLPEVHAASPNGLMRQQQQQ